MLRHGFFPSGYGGSSARLGPLPFILGPEGLGVSIPPLGYPSHVLPSCRDCFPSSSPQARLGFGGFRDFSWTPRRSWRRFLYSVLDLSRKVFHHTGQPVWFLLDTEGCSTFPFLSAKNDTHSLSLLDRGYDRRIRDVYEPPRLGGWTGGLPSRVSLTGLVFKSFSAFSFPCYLFYTGFQQPRIDIAG